MKHLLTVLIVTFAALQLHAQQQTVTGIVTDENNNPLPGVNVVVSNTYSGTSTNFDGEYSLKASVGDILEYSYLGYETTTRTLKKTNITKSINVALAENFDTLDEVIVTAQGIKREKKALGYAVTTVQSEQRNNSSQTTSRILQGKATGIQITSANGAVGNASNIRIRGAASIISHENQESYATINENIFKNVSTSPLSTFSIDVDKAGYSNVRRFINNGQNVPKDAVKIEELINYFSYDLPEPEDDKPFSISMELAQTPWNKETKLMRIGLKGKDLDLDNVPNSNLVFLLDVSGSMNSANKLPLLKSALKVLVNQLREQDKVSIVVYAGAAGLVLKPTSGTNKDAIMEAINNLSAGGSTAGGEGIKLAYKIAQKNFIKNGNNRIVLATDGDFNVGISSDKKMTELIEEQRESGVFLTCLGFGMGNYKDSKLETLADKGNGNHFYIDTLQEAHKVLGTEFFGTFYTIAKDVKIQVEFNPQQVQAYRLIGYENRLLNAEDFNDDLKDAGEIGSGHTVTALYEVIPNGTSSKFVKDVDALKYSLQPNTEESLELATVKFRYKKPDGEKSELITQTVMNDNRSIQKASEDFQFAMAVALFGMQLRDSQFIDSSSKDDIITLAETSKGKDKDGYRAEFIRLVKSYDALK